MKKTGVLPSSYKSLYIKTAKEYLAAIESALSKLSKSVTHKKEIEKAYISAHSLKGESFAMGYINTAEIARNIEELFHKSKENNKPLSQKEQEEVLSSLKNLSDSLENIEKHGEESNPL